VVPPDCPAPSAYAPGVTYETYIVDVVGRTEMVIVVPYYSSEAFSSTTLLGPSGADTRFTRLLVFPADVAQGFTGSPVNIPYNVFIRGGKDYELAVPWGNLLGRYTIVAESGGNSVPVFGERVTDLLQLTRRFCLNAIFNTTNDTDTYRSVMLPLDGYPNGTTGLSPYAEIITQAYEIPFWKYLASAYLGRTGGYRYKFVKLAEFSCRAYLTQDRIGITDVPVDTNSLSPLVVSPKDQSVIEIEIPSTINRLFTPGFNSATNSMEFGSYVLTITNVEASGMSFDLYSSVADDFTCRGFLCAPFLRAL